MSIFRNVMGKEEMSKFKGGGGEYFPVTVNIFPHAESLELPFLRSLGLVAFVKIFMR